MAKDAAELSKLLRKATTHQEVKFAVTACLSFTKSISQSRQSSAQWFPIGESLIQAINPSFIGCFSKREYKELFVEIFIQAPPTESILLLVHTLGSMSGKSIGACYILEKTLHLLDVVIRNNLSRLFIFFTSQSNITSFSESTDRLIQDLVSIPDRAAAVVQGGHLGGSLVLNSDLYSKRMAVSMIDALRYCHDSLQSGEDCSLQFLSSLLGKLQLSGYGRAIMAVLAPRLYGHCCGGSKATEDYIWRRLSQRLLVGVHSLALDGVITDLVLTLSNRGPGKVVDLEKVLGDSIDKDSKVRYVFTNKLLFTRQFEETILVPETISCYLSNSSERIRHVLIPCLRKLLTVWSSATATTRSSFEKHFYISRTIILFCRRLSNEERTRIQNDVTPFILRGIGNHLNSADERLRTVGMTMGELLTELFNGEKLELKEEKSKLREEQSKLKEETSNEDEAKLKFEYEDDERTKYLKSLIQDAKDNEFLSLSILDDDLGTRMIKPNAETNSEFNEREGPQGRTQNGYSISTGIDSDDDDDLVPYDLPDEEESQENGKEPLPIYVKDCLDCLIERKSFPHYEKALNSLENLIRQNSPGSEDLAVEVTRILLHAEDHYGLGSKFLTSQIAIMTACCVRKPKRVAPFLVDQFYEKNYSIQHRLLILDVLVNAAKELSKPFIEKDCVSVPSKLEPPSPTPLTPTWREVVQARIEKKSRRWGSALLKKVQPACAAPNRFSPVCGPCFFYPLITGIDRRIETMDMFGGDYIVLGRVLFTLGTLVYEAENAPGMNAMAAALMQFVFRRSIRHEQSYVRQGSLFALIMALLVVPSRALVTDFQDDLLEVKYLLEEADDPDDQCRYLIGNALGLLAKKSNEGFNSMIEVAFSK